jgi:hypothetical protein
MPSQTDEYMLSHDAGPLSDWPFYRVRSRVLLISLEGIINGFLSLVYKQAVYKRVYKPPTKIASKGAGKWFKADFSPQDSKRKQLRSIPHLLAKKMVQKCTDSRFPRRFTWALISQLALSRGQGGFHF